MSNYTVVKEKIGSRIVELSPHFKDALTTKLARLHPSIHNSHGVNGRILVPEGCTKMHRSHLPE